MVDWDGMEAKGTKEDRGGETQVGRAGEARGAMKLSKAEKVRRVQERSGEVRGGQEM